MEFKQNTTLQIQTPNRSLGSPMGNQCPNHSIFQVHLCMIGMMDTTEATHF